MKKTDLEVMNEMAKSNMDIKSTTHIMGTAICRGGAKLTMGYDKETHHVVANSVFGDPTHYVIAYVINREQFDKLKGVEV